MKTILVFAAAVVAAGMLGWLPAVERDVGDLLPIQALVLTREADGSLSLDGGSGLAGSGGTWQDAVADLRRTAPGDAFFGTVGYIILEDTADCLLDVLDDRQLRPAARVYVGRGGVDAEDVTAFLDAHGGGVTLQTLQAAVLEGRTTRLPAVVRTDGRYRLEDG